MMKIYLALALLFTLCLSPSTAYAQPQLVTDFNPGPADGISASNYLGVHLDDTTMVLPVIDAAGGEELGLLKGSELILLKDINPGSAGSRPQHFVHFRGEVYFTAMDSTGAGGIWATDGTELGTRKAIELDGSAARPGGLIVSVNDELFFSHAGQLYRSVDGISVEALLDAVSFREDNGPSSANYRLYQDGIAFFRKPSSMVLQLYAYTGGEVRQLGEDLPSSSGSSYYGLGDVQGGLVFGHRLGFSTDDIHGTFVYRENTNEIERVLEAACPRFLEVSGYGYIGLIPGFAFYRFWANPPQASLLLSSNVLTAIPRTIPSATVAGKTLFWARENSFSNSLVIVDGTSQDIQLVDGSVLGIIYSRMLVYGPYVFFAAEGNTEVFTSIYYVNVEDEFPAIQELYAFEPTFTGLGSERVQLLTNMGGTLYFTALTDDMVGRELYTLETDLVVSTEAPPLIEPSFSLRFFGQEFTIEGAEDRPARVRAYDLSGRLLRTYETRTNAMEPVAEATGLVIYQAEVDGQLVVGKWVQH